MEVYIFQFMELALPAAMYILFIRPMHGKEGISHRAFAACEENIPIWRRLQKAASSVLIKVNKWFRILDVHSI